MLCNRERADRVMDEHGLAAFIATSPLNIYYLTDWQTPGGWSFPGVAAAVIPRDRDTAAAVLTIDVDLEWPGAKDASWVPEVRGYGGMEALVTRHSIALEHGDLVGDPVNDSAGAGGRAFDPVAAIGAYLDEVGLAGARVGFEDPYVGQQVRDAGRDRLDVVAARDLLRSVRLVKTDAELALLRSGSRKNELAQLVAIEAVAAGATFGEAERVYFASMLQMGGAGQYLAGAVSRPGVGPIEPDAARMPGDAVFFDAFGGYAHYCGDVGRTALVGPPSDVQVATFGALRDGWHGACAELRAGLDSREVAAMVMRSVRAAGASDYLICSPHSVGLEHFDNPNPRSIYEPFVLEAGMVLSVDIPYQSPEVGMFHTEDLVLVLDDGVEPITSNDDRLFVMANGSVERVG
jgi:Xaa-Pro aminopeptidase